MVSPNHQLYPDSNDEVAALGDLMQSAEQIEPNEIVLQDVKPKRKRKPKPAAEPLSWKSVRLLVASVLLMLIVVGVGLILFISPVQVITTSADVLDSVSVLPNAVEEVVDSASDPLIGRWMQLTSDTMTIPAGTFVRVLSADATAGYYNVADMLGNLAIVTSSGLDENSAAPSPDLAPPLGPYSAALGKSQKLLTTIEQNGDLAPGTAVYAMGVRVEDGTWVYEVSPDLVKVYFLPAQHLVWTINTTS